MNSRSSKTKTWNMTIRIVTMAAVLALCRGQAHKSHTHKKIKQITCIVTYACMEFGDLVT